MLAQAQMSAFKVLLAIFIPLDTLCTLQPLSLTKFARMHIVLQRSYDTFRYELEAASTSLALRAPIRMPSMAMSAFHQGIFDCHKFRIPSTRGQIRCRLKEMPKC